MFSQHRNFITPSEKEIRLLRKAEVFLNESKDHRKRYQSLVSFITSASDDEQHIFFNANYWRVFAVFREAFSASEAAFRSKAAREKELSQEMQKEMDGVLMVLNKIFKHLSHLIKKRWQHRAIARILEKLLNHQNILDWRRKGLRLLLIWLSSMGQESPPHAILLFRHSISMMPLTQGFGTLADKLKPQESKFVFDMGLQAPLVPQLANRKEEPLTATHTLMSDVLAFMLSLMHNEVITLGQEPCKVADVSRFSQRAQGLIWIFDLWKRNHLSVLFYDTCNELNIRQDPCRQPACFMWHVEDVPPDSSYTAPRAVMKPIPGQERYIPKLTGAVVDEETAGFKYCPFKLQEEVILPWLQQMLEARYGLWFVMRLYLLRNYTNRALINAVLLQAYYLPFPNSSSTAFETRYRQMMLPTSMYFRWATDPAWPECETSVCAEDTGQPPHLLCVGRQAQLQLCIRSAAIMLNRACMFDASRGLQPANTFMAQGNEQIDAHEVMCRYILAYYHSLCIGEIRESTVLMGVGVTVASTVGPGAAGPPKPGVQPNPFGSDPDFSIGMSPMSHASTDRLGVANSGTNTGMGIASRDSSGSVMSAAVAEMSQAQQMYNTQHTTTTTSLPAPSTQVHSATSTSTNIASTGNPGSTVSTATGAGMQAGGSTMANGLYTVELSAETWKVLREAVLRIVDSWLSDNLFQARQADSVATRLRVRMIQTVLKLWVRCALQTNSQDELNVDAWDYFMSVMASKTKWRDILQCWRGEMKGLTKMLSLHAYGIDLDNLPLNSAKKTRRAILRDRKNQEDEVFASTTDLHASAHIASAVGAEGSESAATDDDALRTPPVLLEVEHLKGEWERTFRLFDDAEEDQSRTDHPVNLVWTAQKAIYLWGNLLVVLGNLNDIKDDQLHADAMDGLHAISKQLSVVADNQGVVYADAQGHLMTSPVVELPLPVYDSITWVFEACLRKNGHAKGRNLAYRQLCQIICKRRRLHAPTAILSQAYLLLHEGLSDLSGTFLAEILLNTTNIFTLGLPGSSVLLSTYLDAILSVVRRAKGTAPTLRRAALTIVGSILYVPMLYDAEDNPSPRGRPRRTSSDRLARPYRSRSSSPLAEVSLAQDAHATDPSHHLPTHETTATFGEIRPRIIRGTTFEILRTAVRTEKDPENICIALVNIGNLVYYHMLQYASVATETNRDTGFATDANSPLAGMTRQKSWLDPPEKHAQGQFRNTETSFQSPPHPPPSGNHDNRRASYTTAANEEKSYQGMVMLLVDTLLGQLNVPAPHNIVCDMVIAQLSLLPDVIGPFVTSQDMNDLDAGDAPDKGAWAALGRLSFLLYTEVMANFSDAIMTALSLDAHSAEEQRLKDNRITRLLFALMDWAMITPNTAKATITTRHRAQKSSSLSKLDATGYSPKKRKDLQPIDRVFTVVKACIQAPYEQTGDSSGDSNVQPSPMYVPDSLSQDTHTQSGTANAHANTPTTPINPSPVPPPGPAGNMPASAFERQFGSRIIEQSATFVLFHLINNFSNFPPTAGVSRLTSKISEDAEIDLDDKNKNRDAVLSIPGVQFFVFNETTIVSCVELPPTKNGDCVARVILRDLTGKHAWDCVVQYDDRYDTTAARPQLLPLLSVQNGPSEELVLPSYGARPAARRRSTAPFIIQDQNRRWLQAPTWNSIDNPTAVDMLDTLLIYLGDTSKECRRVTGERLNLPASPPAVMGRTEEYAVSTLKAQALQEQEYLKNCASKPEISQITKPVAPEEFPTAQSTFQCCRMILSYLGFLSWENRRHFYLLEKSQRLLGDLRVLDNTSSREHHKVGVVFVGFGQEDETAILSNTSGSEKYERFLAGLGWEVDLETHLGFVGGLLRDGKDGSTTPYFADHQVEVVYHVATRMPNNLEDKNLRKKKHIGNDEVQIFWCEHWRNYRPDLIRTKFNEAVIVIYPLSNGLYRVSVLRGQKIPLYGPLGDEMVVPQSSLAQLVRATAIRAGRVMRETAASYKSFYKQREEYLSDIVAKYKVQSQFEEFMETVIQPRESDDVT